MEKTREKVKCLLCKRTETELNLPDRKGNATIRVVTICENEECPLFLDYNRITRWKKGLISFCDVEY